MKQFLLLLFCLFFASLVNAQPIPKSIDKPEKTKPKKEETPKVVVKTKIIYVEKPAPKKEGFEIEMIAVEGGSFNMGSNESDYADEKPIHTVTVSSFKMGKYEITQAQWKAVMTTNPSYFSECDTCPVEYVSYTDVQGFIEELNYKTGKKYRLPTEAEWEFAARGGNNSNDYIYSGSSTPSKVAWTDENSKGKTHPVGKLRPNELGLYDMSGNVLEWCSDWYGEDYYSNSPSNNPEGPVSGTRRVLRGSSWYLLASLCRVADRFIFDPSRRFGFIGFRVVLSQ